MAACSADQEDLTGLVVQSTLSEQLMKCGHDLLVSDQSA